MAEVRPFRAIRYNQEAIGDLSLVVAPIYDVIDEEARDYYYNRHPYNVIRLILNRSKKSDVNPDQRYDRAGEFLDRWLAQRILVQDSVPGIYLYRQRYLMESEYMECTGMVARVRAVDFAEGVVLPHEDVLPKPIEDRMKLLARTRTNLSTVYGLYSDPAERLKAPILAEMERFPLAQFQTNDGIAHDLWGVTDEKFVERITGFLAGRKLYIADGHHRYQTALEHSRSLRESGEITDDEDPRNFVLMMIVEMENPGLSVLPVHRVVTAPAEVEDVLKGVERWFTVAEVDVPKGPRSGQMFHLVKRLEEAGQAGHAFGLYCRDERFLLLSWKAGTSVEKEIAGDYSDVYKRLDVAILQKIVLERVMGIATDRRSVEGNLKFTRDPLEAAREVDSGSASMAFLLNATTAGQVRDVADQGEKMPQKSTFFHPKPCSGVVMNRITEW